MRTYTTKQGDCWDNIALAKYGTEKLCGLIMAANPDYLDTLFFGAGVVLAIPENPAAEYFEEPKPWENRRNSNIPAMVEQLIAETTTYGEAVSDHAKLENRDLKNQHPADAVTYKNGTVKDALDGIKEGMEQMHQKPYEHEQKFASRVWQIPHQLGTKFPLIACYTEDGTLLMGKPDFKNATDDEICVLFANLQTGRALVRQ